MVRGAEIFDENAYEGSDKDPDHAAFWEPDDTFVSGTALEDVAVWLGYTTAEHGDTDPYNTATEAGEVTRKLTEMWGEPGNDDAS